MKSVVCIMLANGRPEMVKRAVASFHAQQYEQKRLLIWNTGDADDFLEFIDDRVDVQASGVLGSVGALRNMANDVALYMFPNVDLIAHWDSDDWSHPQRLAEQIAMQERTGADIVGYREGVFWDSTKCMITVDPSVRVGAGVRGTVSSVGEAWLYRAANPGHGFGSSFLYPRATWERRHFKDDVGEDTLWLLHGRFKVHFVPSTWNPMGRAIDPRMICSIHGANTSAAIVPNVPEWKRDPMFDAYCMARMAL